MTEIPPPSRLHCSRAPQMELRAFAAWFTADWPARFPDFATGARLFIGRLAFERRVGLADEIALQ